MPPRRPPDRLQLPLPFDYAPSTDDPEGPSLLPAAAQEDGWVSATGTRNYVRGGPLLDWLDLYGKDHGYLKDSQLPGYDWRLDFGPFIFEQGRRFEKEVIALLRASNSILEIGFGPSMERRSAETLAAMRQGLPFIYQAALRDHAHRIQGVPDLLVRSDVLAKWLPVLLTEEEAAASAPAIDSGPWHYRALDIKFRNLDLSAGGELLNGPSEAAYKVQLFLYNRALGETQGFEPPESYMLGRSWKQGNNRGSSCLDRLAKVSQRGTLAHAGSIADAADEAVAWVRRVRSEGRRWRVLPRPTVPELYPDPKGDGGGWGQAQKAIAQQLEDLTLLWQVRDAGRRLGHAAGVFRWTDPAVTPDLLGVSGQKRPDTFIRMLEINTARDGSGVRPPVVQAERQVWHEAPPLEFYVDFETVSDLADDFTTMPEKNGQPLIFMIGCGHLDGGDWRFSCFTVESLTEGEEERIIDEWLAHMERIRRRLAHADSRPRIIHWSHAEDTYLTRAYNSARARHGRDDWADLPWYDFLVKVMRAEPVVVRGALAFGLKVVAKALYSHGLINTKWEDGPSDGLGAMVGAWRAQEEAARSGIPLSLTPLMGDIQAYNQVDCKVIMEIVRYLRQQH